MLGGRATTPLHDTPLQFPNWEGVNEQSCSCMRKTLLCRTAQLDDARTPSFQVPGSHPLLPKPRLFHVTDGSPGPGGGRNGEGAGFDFRWRDGSLRGSHCGTGRGRENSSCNTETSTTP